MELLENQIKQRNHIKKLKAIVEKRSKGTALSRPDLTFLLGEMERLNRNLSEVNTALREELSQLRGAKIVKQSGLISTSGRPL